MCLFGLLNERSVARWKEFVETSLARSATIDHRRLFWR
jgi:hypothetical protein